MTPRAGTRGDTHYLDSADLADSKVADPRDFTQTKTINGNAYAYPQLVAAGLMPRFSTDAAGPWTGPGADLTIGQRQAVITARLVDDGTVRADSVDAATLARGRALIIEGEGQW